MIHEKRQNSRRPRGAVRQNGSTYSTRPRPHGRSRSRRAGSAAAKWLALGVAVPMLSFFTTVYASTLLRDVGAIAHRYAALFSHSASPKIPVDPTAENTASLKLLPAGSASLGNPNAPLTVRQYREDHIPFTLVMGGTPGTRRSPVREGVADFVKQSGATAGLNGTFFANASLTGTDNLLIGPSLCPGDPHLLVSPFDNKPQLAGRPMVLMSSTRTEIVPYQQGTADNQQALQSFLPGMTDAFLGGVWLVHGGIAAGPSGIDSFNMKDAMDPRRRAFFAIMPDGRPALGATTYVATSAELASALQKAGVREAVLLDSGFSTSLVFQDKILVTGHTSAGVPSRPVPHALVLFGQPTGARPRATEGVSDCAS